MATTIVTKSGSGAPTASDLVAGELAVDLTNKRLYTENSSGTVLELGTNPASDVTFGDNTKAIFGAGSDLQIYSDGTTGQVTGNVNVTGSVTTDGLTIDGDITVSDATPSLTLSDTGGTNQKFVVSHNGATSYLAFRNGTNYGALQFLADNGTATVTRQSISSNGDISFYEDTGTTPKFFWDASAESLGIGTTLPSQLLELSGATAPAIRLNDTTYNQYAEISTANAGSLILKADVGNGGTGSTYIGFEVDGANEAMRIDANGNLLVGRTASTTAKLHLENATDVHMDMNSVGDNRAKLGSKTNDLYIGHSSSAANIIFKKNIASDDHPADSGTETMRIDASGTIRTTSSDGTAPTVGSGCVSVQGRSNSASVGILRLYKTGDDGNIVDFYRTGNTLVGKISVSETTTSYVTSSDYRLKENIVGMSGATERLKQLKPSRFNFIADADTTVDGFLAHEVQDIVPEAITGTKDAMMDEEYEVTPAVLDDDGNVVTEAVMGTRSVPDYQGIDQSKLVPLLVATIQELEARIAQLES